MMRIWTGFNVFVLALLEFDLGVSNRGVRELSIREVLYGVLAGVVHGNIRVLIGELLCVSVMKIVEGRWRTASD